MFTSVFSLYTQYTQYTPSLRGNIKEFDFSFPLLRMIESYAFGYYNCNKAQLNMFCNLQETSRLPSWLAEAAPGGHSGAGH